MHLYVYYKAPVADAPALRAAVERMQQGLGVPAALSRRPQAKDGMHTWMESYPGSAPGFGAILDAAAEAAGLAQWIAGARHAEYFEELSTCA